MDSLGFGIATASIGNRELADGLRRVLDRRYRRILRDAEHAWERRFAGGDPSDACVSVRISGPSHAISKAA